MNTIYQQNYNKMFELGYLKILDKDDGYARLKSAGFMDLIIEKYCDDKIVLAHYYEQNGDLVPDPDMLIKIYPDMQAVEVLSYQDSLCYQTVYTDDGVYPKRKAELNKFLKHWIINLKNQGFIYNNQLLNENCYGR